jgi:hypothetical protein
VVNTGSLKSKIERFSGAMPRKMAGEATAATLNYHVGTVLAARLFPGQFTVPHRMFR